MSEESLENPDPFNKSTLLPRSPPKPTKHCPLCQNEDSERMIKCTTCRRRYHINCVKADSDTPLKTWRCRNCRKVHSQDIHGKPPKDSPQTGKSIEKALDKIERGQHLASPLLTLVDLTNESTNATSNINGDNTVTNDTSKLQINSGLPNAQSTVGIISGVTKAMSATGNFERATNIALNMAGVTNVKNNSDYGTGVLNVLPKTMQANSTTISRNQRAGSRSSGSSKSSRQRKELALAQLEEERALQEKRDEEYLRRQEQRDREYLRRKYEIENISSDDSASINDEIPATSRTMKWVGDQGRSKVSFHDPLDEDEYNKGADISQPAPVNSCRESITSKPSKQPILSDEKAAQNSRPFNNPSHSLPWLTARNQSQFLNSTSFPTYQNQTGLVDDGISMRQLAVRQVVPKDLPIFSGDPVDWPMFISSYVRSTQTCNFSDEENLARLQRCLKGKALEAVRSKMIFPNMVPNILNTLRMLFGRPQMVIQMMIDQLRREPAVNPDKLETVVSLSMSVQHLCAVTEATGMKDHLNNPLLLQELIEKLPGILKLNWATHVMKKDEANLSVFNEWLFELADAAGSVASFDFTHTKRNTGEPKTHPIGNKRTSMHAAHHGDVRVNSSSNAHPNRSSTDNCIICSKGNHSVPDCTKFQSLKTNERWEAMRSNRLCRKCLRHHHVTRCRQYKDCGVYGCSFKHHPLLHDPEVHTTPSTTRTAAPSSSAASSSSSAKPSASKTVATMSSVALSSSPKSKRLLFRVLPVILYGNKIQISTFAFLDEGSSMTLLDEEIASKLNLQGPYQDLNLRWTGGTIRKEKGSRCVSLKISGIDRHNSKFSIDDVHTVEALDLPVQTLNLDADTTVFAHLRGIPFNQYHDAKPRILIGLKHWKLGAPLTIREGNWGEPVAANTRLGWTVFGAINHMSSEREDVALLHHISELDNNLHQQVKEFFTTENFGVNCPVSATQSKEDQRATAIMEATTTITGNRYKTGLLWKFDKISLPNSFPLAMRRLMSLERKMERSPDLAKNLEDQMEGYVKKGYARKLSLEETKTITPRTWYLPTFPVINPNKPGKIRIVWDAAAEVNGTSLNSMLLTGPDLLTPLSDVLQRFREKPIAVTGDIREMFHRVQILEEDQQSQRFLWRGRNKAHAAPDTYVMTVMTFGATCSPSCAQFVKNLNATRFEATHPRASYAIQNNHYVDDWLDGFNTENEALEIAKDVINIHAAGGFEIRNFTSNSRRVTAELGGDELAAKNLNSPGDCAEAEGAKVLGMWWSTEDDSFYYHLNQDRISEDIRSGKRAPTKREVLRIVMTVFDPLGLVAPFIVYAKMLLRDVWKTGTGWDEPICDNLCARWNKWVDFLSELESIRIPRCYSIANPRSIELHVFVDASENAFAAAVYFRIETDEGVTCKLVSAKTKVAPQKPMTIPRLELQAAVLGSRLAVSVSKAHSVTINRKIMWSDSIDVLSWIQSTDKRFRQFIAFRVGEILETSNRQDWRWVPTKDNTADQATKWKPYPELNSNSSWFNGPQFLQLSEEKWPSSERLNLKTQPEEELKPVMSHAAMPESMIVPKPENVSKWRVFIRATAFALRFFRLITFLPRRNEQGYTLQIAGKTRRLIPLTVDEIKRAEQEVFRMAQMSAFSPTIISLKENPDRPLERSSPLYKLTPFLDDTDVLRVKGRASRIEGVNYDAVNPVILPHDHYITKLVILHYHEKFHHINHETAINEIRQRFAISRLRAVMKRIRSSCQWCRIERARPIPPKMGDHPLCRLADYIAPFSYVGVDYFGPLEVVVGRHTEKRWVSLFTCLTVRAVHIEIVYTLDKKSCMMALRNFISRRGTPLEIHSDNGTNFRGTSNDLVALRKLKSELATAYPQEYESIRWRFNPPSAPHMGGCWERLVRSVKKCVFAAMPTRRPNDETLRSFLMEAEATVNSRPLTYLPIDPELEEALTPNHFLIGSSGGIKPFAPFDNNVETLVRSFELAQKMADHFWSRWLKEYLPDLTRTTKWFENVKKIEVGDLVIIMDDKERNSWRKGEVIDVVTGGRSSQVRRVTIRTPDGVYERPATKVAVLDVSPME